VHHNGVYPQKFLASSRRRVGGIICAGRSRRKAGKKYRTALIGSGWWGKVIAEMTMVDGSVDMRRGLLSERSLRRLRRPCHR